MSKLITDTIETLDGSKSVPVQHINRAEASTYDSGTNERSVESILDTVVPITDYTALRNYTGRATQVRITTPGIAGFFYYDSADTTSVDNGGTVIVSSNGKRWKRMFEGAVNVFWFMTAAQIADVVSGAALLDVTAAIQAALNSAVTASAPFGIQEKFRGVSLYCPRGRYRITGGVTGKAGTSIIGDGYESTVFIHEGTSGDVFHLLELTTAPLTSLTLRVLRLPRNLELRILLDTR